MIATSDEPGLYTVSDVHGHRIMRDNTLEFRVRWEGYSAADDSWVAERDLSCDVIARYFQENKVRLKPPTAYQDTPHTADKLGSNMWFLRLALHGVRGAPHILLLDADELRTTQLVLDTNTSAVVTVVNTHPLALRLSLSTLPEWERVHIADGHLHGYLTTSRLRYTAAWLDFTCTLDTSLPDLELMFARHILTEDAALGVTFSTRNSKPRSDVEIMDVMHALAHKHGLTLSFHDFPRSVFRDRPVDQRQVLRYGRGMRMVLCTVRFATCSSH